MSLPPPPPSWLQVTSACAVSPLHVLCAGLFLCPSYAHINLHKASYTRITLHEASCTHINLHKTSYTDVSLHEAAGTHSHQQLLQTRFADLSKAAAKTHALMRIAAVANQICPLEQHDRHMLCTCMQIVAYNKMDVPESSDYWPDIQQSLAGAGVAPHSMCAISAVSGQGVLELIRMVHSALDELPSEVIRNNSIALFIVTSYLFSTEVETSTNTNNGR